MPLRLRRMNQSAAMTTATSTTTPIAIPAMAPVGKLLWLFELFETTEGWEVLEVDETADELDGNNVDAVLLVVSEELVESLSLLVARIS